MQLYETRTLVPGASTIAGEATIGSNGFCGYGACPYVASTGNTMSNHDIRILYYGGSTFKSLCGTSGVVTNITNQKGIRSSFTTSWNSTAAITSIRFTTQNAINFTSTTKFQIYGYN